MTLAYLRRFGSGAKAKAYTSRTRPSQTCFSVEAGQDGQLGQVVGGDHPYVVSVSGSSTHYLLLLFLYFYLTHAAKLLSSS